MKIGDKVKHKLTKQKMTILRIGDNGLVATCLKDVPEPWQFYGMTMPGDKAICLLTNLELIDNNQIEMFA